MDIPGYPQHLIVRGNNRGLLFRDDADRLNYLRLLEEGLEKHEIDLHAFVLMPNHVHLLATPGREGEVSDFMHRLGSHFARRVNGRWGRSGTLFEGRFRSSLVDRDSYLVACMRYIDLNPVRAGIVAHPRDFPWSSYRRNAGIEPQNPLVPSPAYLILGNTPESRADRYRELCEAAPSVETIESIRKSIRSSAPLGIPAFIRTTDRPRGRPRKS